MAQGVSSTSPNQIAQLSPSATQPTQEELIAGLVKARKITVRPFTTSEKLLIGLSYLIVIFTFPISMFFCLRSVGEYERIVRLRLGLLAGGFNQKSNESPENEASVDFSSYALGPGLVFCLPCVDTITRVDLRVLTFDVPPQEVLTKDSVTVMVDAVVYYKVVDAVSAVLSVENHWKATQLLAAADLRNAMGTRSLATILSDRERIADYMRAQLAKATAAWGVVVERVEMRDVRLPVTMQRAMAAEAEASREAKAKIIAAEGELQASHALRQAAETIGKAPQAMQLRYLQTLNTISAEKNSTIVFPVPIEFFPKKT